MATSITNEEDMAEAVEIKVDGVEKSKQENCGDGDAESVDRGKKKTASLSLEEKVSYVKKLIDISTAYAKYVSKTIGSTQGTRVGKPEESLRGTGREALTLSSDVPQNGRDSTVMDSTQNNEFVSEFFEGTLKDYQINGFKWLKTLYENAANGILADEMGLGKTVQAISMITHLISKNYKGPFLVIAPLSTLPNWLSEFQKFCPQVPSILFHGNVEERKKMKKKFKVQNLPNQKRTYPIIIVSYDTVMSESTFFSKYIWRYVVVDEGHRLKNHNCKLARLLSRVQSKNRLLLTGTPLQNNLEELWSLLHFLTPEIFDNVKNFELLVSSDDLVSNTILEQEMKEGILSKIHTALAPFILRRMKKDVNLNLPQKKEVLVYAPMSQLQWEMYKAAMDGSITRYLGLVKDEDELERPSKRMCTGTVSYNISDSDDDDDDDDDDDIDDALDINPSLIKDDFSASKLTKYPVDKEGNNCFIHLKMQNPVIQLRKISNHPYLVQMPLSSTGQPLINERLVKVSGKLMVLDLLLPHLKTRGHKVLLFSTMTRILDLIEEFIQLRGYHYSRLDGAVKLSDRIKEINSFMNDDASFLFLISTRAGNLGLNLVKADTVILFDSDWNPQVDLQAQDRCHRIGQTKPVVVYRLVTKGSIEEKIVGLAQTKRKLEKIIFHNDCYRGNPTNKVENTINIEELKALLHSNDFSKVVHTSQNGRVLTKREIEDLLDRSDMY